MLFVATVVVTGPAAPAVAQADLDAAQRRANEAARELSQAEEEIARANDAVDHLKARTAQLEARVGTLRDQVGQLAVRRYVEGTKPLTRLLGLANTNEVVRAQQFAQVYAGSANDSVRRYRAEREDLRDQVKELEEKQEEQADALANLARRRTAALAEVDRLARAEQQRKAQAAQEEQRRAQAAAAPGAGQPAGSRPAPASAPRAGAPDPGAGSVAATGEWICPVNGPRAFTNDYGAPRGGGRSHQGNDLLSPRGTPVVASVSGSVRHHNASLGGRSYYLDGDDGVTYFGTHMDGYGASGQVSAGTVIGYVGDDGDAKGTPHLHFEMHPGGGGPINPYPTLVKYC